MYFFVSKLLLAVQKADNNKRYTGIVKKFLISKPWYLQQNKKHWKLNDVNKKETYGLNFFKLSLNFDFGLFKIFLSNFNTFKYAKLSIFQQI